MPTSNLGAARELMVRAASLYGEQSPEYLHARAAYNDVVVTLTEQLGPNAHVQCVDVDLYQQYHAAFTSLNGHHPHGHVTRDEALRWMADYHSLASVVDPTT